MNHYRVTWKLSHVKLATHRAAAAGLISALVGLALFTVIHVHGVTDPGERHNAVDLSLQAQIGAGLALVSAGSVLPAPVALGSSLVGTVFPIPLILHSIQVTRGPPGSPQ